MLYEMLTGQRTFEGSDVSDTLASILKSEPDWRALPADTPPAVRRVPRRCLDKDPRKRIRDIADIRLEIQNPIAEEAVGLGPAAAPIVRARERAAWMLVALSLVSLAVLVTYIAATAARDEPNEEVTRFQISAPAGAVLGREAVGSLDYGAANATVSPDGTRVVFVASDRAGKAMLWIRALDSFDSLPLIGSEGATQPFWAPDSRALGFLLETR